MQLLNFNPLKEGKMTVKDVIITACKQKHVSMTELAERAGYSNKSAISVMLSRNNGMGMRVETLLKLLDAIEYQVTIEDVNDDCDSIWLDDEPEDINWRGE